MTNALYWIALQNILGYGSIEVSEILENIEDVGQLFDKSLKRNQVTFLSDKSYKKLISYDMRKAESVIKYCDKNNIGIVTIDDEIYPQVLKRIINPPTVLYVRGELPNFNEEVGIGMIGTRNSSLNSMIIAATLSYRIAQAGAIVVSGGANGIDTKCTQGALFAKKPSVIVRPCGVDYNYLNSLSDIRKQVENCGAVSSEVQPLGRVERDAFQVRNRIIAALSMGVVAIEVPEKSGVLITVGYALEYGKDIFVVPGDLSNENYRGSNKLLQDGAVPVYSAADILNEYIFAYPHKLSLRYAGASINDDDIFLKLQIKYSKKAYENDATVSEKKKQSKKSLTKRVKEKLTKDSQKENVKKEKIKFEDLNIQGDENLKLVYDCFELEPISLDDISEQTGLDASDVMFNLTELEINGVINSLPGGRFEIK